MAEVAAESVPPPRSGPGLLVILLAALLAAGVAGGVVYFIAGKKDDTAQAAGKDGEQKATGKPRLPAMYVKLDPPFVANFEAKGAMRFLQVSVDVMTRDPVTADLIKQHDAMIRNDLLMLFGNQSYDTLRTSEGKEQLRTAALDAVRKVIGAEGGDGKKVEQLYFTSFVMQ